jgi:hypothetical protein
MLPVPASFFPRSPELSMQNSYSGLMMPLFANLKPEALFQVATQSTLSPE